MSNAGQPPCAQRVAAVLCLALLAAGGCTSARYPVPQLPPYEIEKLRSDALRALPPTETGDFLPSDLVEVVTLEPGIRLDVRYATADNFLRAPVYPEARVFLQRPAAEAVVRAHQALRPQGYGLLLFDGYRPWYVTQLFWDATPPEKREFVADPATGLAPQPRLRDRPHAVRPRDGARGRDAERLRRVLARAHPDYAGGTAAQRAARDLLRRTMEAEGFTVNDNEWWHFDCRDWQSYRIGNEFFKDLAPAR